MSAVLQTVYASAPPGEAELLTLTLEHPAFAGLTVADSDGVIRLARAYEPVEVRLEDGALATFRPTGVVIGRPEKAVAGRQDLQFQLDNVSGEVLQAIEAAQEAGGPVTATLRVYLWSDLTGPSNPPVVMRVVGGTITQLSAAISAAFGDLVNQAWPRELYTPEQFPGLKYW